MLDLRYTNETNVSIPDIGQGSTRISFASIATPVLGQIGAPLNEPWAPDMEDMEADMDGPDPLNREESARYALFHCHVCMIIITLSTDRSIDQNVAG